MPRNLNEIVCPWIRLSVVSANELICYRAENAQSFLTFLISALNFRLSVEVQEINKLLKKNRVLCDV
jgi:hypothetical protein